MPRDSRRSRPLRDHGLKTAAFVGSSVLAPPRGLAQGFDSYRAASQNCVGIPARRRAAEVIDDAVAWIGSQDGSPFFAWIHLFDTHRPYDLTDDFKNRHHDPYLSAVLYEDAQLGRVLSYLEERNLLDETLIVVAGDHGEALGDHGDESHGIFLYEEALRVPLVIRGPGVRTRRLMPVVRLIDVMPTVLDLFGIRVTRMDGASLKNIDREPPSAAREVYAETMYPLRFGWSPLRSLRSDRFKFIEGPRPELFDLSTDPMEQRNVVADHPQVAEAMRRRLRAIDSSEAAPAPAPRDVDRAVLERIGSLGYVSGAPTEPRPTSGALPDPKDRIDTFNKLTALQRQNTEMRRSFCR